MKLLLLKLLSYLPRPLPVGKTEFHKWADRIILLSGKFADEDSMKYALASNIIHLDHKVGHIPDIYFIKVLRKAAANQVASAVFQDIKLKQEENFKKSIEAENKQKDQQLENEKTDGSQVI
jgi:thiamine pyrophosphate-dependent acetolactate synthase large subunit-like protein